ncbi:MAG: hypothetical protein ABSA67_14080 [Candidatus Brocadiia bacterium]|jgi:hypothetical protein
MSETALQPVAADELLARFIKFERWFRRTDRTVKPDAFIPPPDLQLSVIRHISLSEDELWKVGQRIADEAAKTNPRVILHGRADLHVYDVSKQALHTEAAPDADCPNHAHITGWPAEKSERKSIAQLLAAKAVLHLR